MSVEVKGADEIKRKLQSLLKEFPKVVIKGIYQEAQVILKESQRVCPVDSGRLRASAYVSNPDADGEDTRHVRIGYGASYALPVHEMTEVHHADGTQAKFLSAPVDAHKNSFTSDVAERIKSDPRVEEWKKGDL